MRKTTLLIISLFLYLGLITGCSTAKEMKNITNTGQTNTTVKEQDIREIAYNQLNSKDKERIKGTWKDSKLTKITLKEGMGNIIDKSYMGKEVYLVDFPTKGGGVQSNMVVYLSIDSNKLLGYGFVD